MVGIRDFWPIRLRCIGRVQEETRGSRVKRNSDSKGSEQLVLLVGQKRRELRERKKKEAEGRRGMPKLRGNRGDTSGHEASLVASATEYWSTAVTTISNIY